jgi:hypothetical protein
MPWLVADESNNVMLAGCDELGGYCNNCFQLFPQAKLSSKVTPWSGCGNQLKRGRPNDNHFFRYTVKTPADITHLIRKISKALSKSATGFTLGARRAFNEFAGTSDDGCQLAFPLFCSLLETIFAGSKSKLNYFEQDLLFRHFDWDNSGSIGGQENLSTRFAGRCQKTAWRL